MEIRTSLLPVLRPIDVAMYQTPRSNSLANKNDIEREFGLDVLVRKAECRWVVSSSTQMSSGGYKTIRISVYSKYSLANTMQYAIPFTFDILNLSLDIA